MFGVPVGDVKGDLRRQAKTINFGIIYGISAFGLAERLGIPNAEASAFIKQYFERFPGIRTLHRWTKFCREKGYVTTLFGRVCPTRRSSHQIPRSAPAWSARPSMRRFQGSAADIIRRAMIRMEDALRGARLSARMLLQVHDELVFEVPDDEVEATLPVVSKVMAGAFPAVELRCRSRSKPRG